MNELWSVVGSKAQEYGTFVGSKAQEWRSVAGTSVKGWGEKMSGKTCAVKDFFKRDWTLTEKVLVVVCCILLGVVYGFLIAPIKKGVSIGTNNGNTYADDGEWYLEDEEE